MDESGLLMAPLVRRSWAPRGHPPELRQKARHREKVSVAAALWLPVGGPLGLSFQTAPNGYFNNSRMADFLRASLNRTQRPLVVVWDGGTMHQGDPIRALLKQAGQRLRLERLPPYAPMLNPVESLWSWLKYSRLNNFAPTGVAELNNRITEELTAIRGDRERLRGFWEGSELTQPLTLLI
jgi:putative transposase